MTSLWRNLLAWTFRHLIALVLILIILIAGRYALPPAVQWVQAQREAANTLSAERAALAEAEARFADWAAERRVAAEADAAALRQMPEAQLRARRAAIEPALERQRAARMTGPQIALAAVTGDGDRIFAHYRAGAEIALMERERVAIDALIEARSARIREQDLAARRAAAVQALAESNARWHAANARVQALSRRPLAGARDFVCRTARPAGACDNYRALVAARAERDAALAANRGAQQTIAAIDRAGSAYRAGVSAAARISDVLAEQQASLAARAAALARESEGNWWLWVRQPVAEMLPTALLILALAIFAPAIGKALLYFVVAPAAARRQPIRIDASDSGAAAMASAGSAASQRVALEPGEELLLLPQAIQSSPHRAAKRTQWLLDRRMPLSSIASGMVALVRMRSAKADFALVSATGSPIAEVALIRLEAGSAFVLRPRALRGIVQPIGRPVRIDRRWRIGRLSAWLTLQFRYLVFHGPCTLIVEGTRGVRLEPAGPGRGINQAATIGFSAGLLYSVRRSEAFGAYLIGRQELFNDSFASAGGWYLYEEMPRHGVSGGPWGRGLRGLGDAALKVFGV